MASGYVDWHKRTYTDIIAQSIEKILVDIGAVSVEQVPVNITAQDLEKMSIDVKAQTIERLIIAESYGATKVTTASGDLNPNQTLYPVTIYGKGVVLGGFIYFFGDSYTKNIDIAVEIDEGGTRSFSLDIFKTWNITNPSSWPLFLIKDGSSDNMWAVSASKGYTFDEYYRLILSLGNYDANPEHYDITIMYALR